MQVPHSQFTSSDPDILLLAVQLFLFSIMMNTKPR